ncbi:MAG: carbohydrate ABC transporter permease, partial [Chloroflexota bacterium]
MAAIAFTFLYPFLWMFVATVKPETEIAEVGLLAQSYGFHNYNILLERIPILRALLNSFIVAVASTAAVLVFCSMAGYALARLKFKGRGLVHNVILFTMVMPFQLTLIPLYVLMVRFGWVDTYAALILPYTMSAFAILLFRQFFLQIPQDLIDAARLDGLGELKILFRIFWPLSKPVLITVGIVHFMGIWNEALWPLIVIRDKMMMTMPQMVALFAVAGQAEGQFGVQLAGAALMTVPVVIAFIFLQRYFIE